MNSPPCSDRPAPGARSVLSFIVPILGAAILAAGCQDPAAPTAVIGAPLISDGAHQGSDDFYFLPPLVEQPWTTGAFDGARTPRVEVCELEASTCAASVATYTTTAGPDGETIRVDPIEEHYSVNWHTDRFSLDLARTCRIEVWVGTDRVGFADVTLGATGKELKNVDTDEFIALKDGRTLPIKFRLEGCLPSATTDATCDGVDDDCDGTVDEDVDSDGDGVCNDADVCPDGDDLLDDDADGVPNACDVCPGSADTEDADADRVPDGCDPCPADATNDSDGDGLCDSDDPSPYWPEGWPTSGCAPSGHACESNGDCCSGRCVLDANGLRSCQPIDGCQATGDLCSSDSDCCTQHPCNAATSPGLCEFFPGGTVGLCSGLTGNLAPGSLCGVSSTTGSQCCNGSAECQPTLDGVERCYGDAAAECYPIGETCQFRDQCCTKFCGFDDAGSSVCLEDPCPSDADNDGVCDDVDECPGGSDRADVDDDGVPDGCDRCPLGPDDIDIDANGVPDACDDCAAGDVDLDGVCDDIDPCVDPSGSGACTPCPLGDPTADLDGDGICDAEDPFPYWPQETAPSCAVVGESCRTNRDCCSARCEVGDNGVSVCQPIAGCRPQGELCTTDTDCCNRSGTCNDPADTGLCELFAGTAIGRCSSLQGSLPTGSVCGDEVSSGSQCCGGSATCRSTADGVDRCYGDAAVACYAAGIECLFRDQCCSLSCSPDLAGTPRCD